MTKLLRNLDYSFINSDKDKSDFLSFFIKQINLLAEYKDVNILIDYSLMSRTWIASFVWINIYNLE